MHPQNKIAQFKSAITTRKTNKSLKPNDLGGFQGYPNLKLKEFFFLLKSSVAVIFCSLPSSSISSQVYTADFEGLLHRQHFNTLLMSTWQTGQVLFCPGFLSKISFHSCAYCHVVCCSTPQLFTPDMVVVH